MREFSILSLIRSPILYILLCSMLMFSVLLLGYGAGVGGERGDGDGVRSSGDEAMVGEVLLVAW